MLARAKIRLISVIYSCRKQLLFGSVNSKNFTLNPESLESKT